MAPNSALSRGPQQSHCPHVDGAGAGAGAGGQHVLLTHQ